MAQPPPMLTLFILVHLELHNPTPDNGVVSYALLA